MNKRYKVLVLAGGGIFGCIPVHFLAMLPAAEQTLEGVNCLSGCSIGGILACAYALGQSFRTIDQVFQQRAKECFTKRTMAKVNPLACPIYRQDTLDKVIHDMIGDETVYDIHKHFPKLDFVTNALDLTEDKYLVFENISGRWNELPMFSIAGMTSAAPSYFPGRVLNGHCIVDGGIIDVDSIATAVTEARKDFDMPFEQMDVLVLGTGEDVDPDPMTPEKYNALGLIGMAQDFLVPYATLSNKMFSKTVTSKLGLGYFNYWNPIKTNGKLDDYKQIPDLVKETEKYRTSFQKVWSEWKYR